MRNEIQTLVSRMILIFRSDCVYFCLDFFVAEGWLLWTSATESLHQLLPRLALPPELADKLLEQRPVICRHIKKHALQGSIPRTIVMCFNLCFNWFTYVLVDYHNPLCFTISICKKYNIFST